MTTLALDLGTTFGYAFSDGRSGVFKLMGDDRRYWRFWRWLEQNATVCTAVAYERVTFRHASGAAGDVYGGLRAVLIAFCESHAIPLQPVLVSTIKRHATGSARADKDAMIAAALKRGWTPADHNEADALWLLDFVRFGDISISANSGSARITSDERQRSKRR